jgi:hypothetical protein
MSVLSLLKALFSHLPLTQLSLWHRFARLTHQLPANECLLPLPTYRIT